MRVNARPIIVAGLLTFAAYGMVLTASVFIVGGLVLIALSP